MKGEILPARSFYTFLTDKELKKVIADSLSEFIKRGGGSVLDAEMNRAITAYRNRYVEELSEKSTL
ncbi:MAG: hypothetical protein QGH26_03740 [Candidatus Pacebacteria bacterium]|jgi:hypothetical protein|nr:hypothetical protein [Candidatus Paceibacterota bacterium]|tara:strand:- start:184 stop:381 length:198 start_codon:yes stop_codon:yes gene_type:complete